MWNVDYFSPHTAARLPLHGRSSTDFFLAAFPVRIQILICLSLCQAEPQSASPGPGVAAYQFMLEQNVGRTMLQFQVSGWSVVQHDRTSSHPVPRPTSIHQHCIAAA